MTSVETYSDLRRYDGAAVERDERETVIPCIVQPRDVQIVRDVWEHKFLTAHQLRELHWPNSAPRVARRRLAALFQAGYLERFRPITLRGGSFPWTYHLGAEGHRLLRQVDVLPLRARYEFRPVYDYRYVLHEIHLNGWVLAWRRLLGERLVAWRGEREVHPPRGWQRAQLQDDERVVEGLRDPTPRLVRPDAIVEVARRSGEGTRSYFIEYDRTRRIDKNFEKFRRYDTFLCWWWSKSSFAERGPVPFVVFICQDEGQRDAFLTAADRELTGYVSGLRDAPNSIEHVGRDQVVIAVEKDMHTGEPVASRVPRRVKSERRDVRSGCRPVRLPESLQRSI